MCVSLTSFLFWIAIWPLSESNCPFGFLLVRFPLGSSYFVFVFLSLWCLWWEVWDNCIDSWSLPSFQFYNKKPCPFWGSVVYVTCGTPTFISLISFFMVCLHVKVLYVGGRKHLFLFSAPQIVWYKWMICFHKNRRILLSFSLWTDRDELHSPFLISINNWQYYRSRK